MDPNQIMDRIVQTIIADVSPEEVVFEIAQVNRELREARVPTQLRPAFRYGHSTISYGRLYPKAQYQSPLLEILQGLWNRLHS